MKLTKTLFILLSMVAASKPGQCANKLSVQLPNQKQGPVYEVACVRPKGDFPYLVLRTNAGKTSQTVSKVQLTGLKHPSECKLVRMSGSDTQTSEAVVVTGDSDEKQQIHVVQVLPNRRGLRPLIGTWHEGSVDYSYDSKGNLNRIRLHYVAGHAIKDDELPGHAYVMRDYIWRTNSFQTGPFIVDDTAESNATLLELLLVPGASRLGVKSEDKSGATLTFSPTGIFASKVQPDLLWASTIRARIGYARSGKTDYKARLLELSTVNKK